ncbi:MAG: type II secretion system F family protein [Candidatus Omnitrophica bacterium]|nr:type II secretion system F family protein [Candidatus Omnitrophota bacterium]MDD5352741.1 type II secretion system F family protein [Candidatus Omnitrophota bacterium]MDD5550340.1 type II secretion system F family protein [Candidatus Omnitrophota bacterium]
MPQFHYVAKDIRGKTLNGTIEAADNPAVVSLLHKRGLTIISLSLEKEKVFRKKGVKLEDLVMFSRQLATMVDSGISVVQALSILAEQTENKTLSVTTQTIRKDIEGGANLCDSLAKHPRVFSELYINMVKAGETSGKLDTILDRLATYLEKANALQRKVRSSLVYPAVVISMAFIITIVLLVKVVPIFKNIFDTLGGTLPLPTQILIAVSDTMRKNFILAVVVVFSLAFLFKKYISTSGGRYKFDQTLLRLPVFGPLFRNVAVAKFSRTLATLVQSGVPIINALNIVGKTAGNKIVEENVTNACSSIKEGEPISGPLSKGNVFPPMVVRMISVGEQTGQLEKMLNKIADFYEEQVDAAVSGLVSMIEPLVIAFLGIIIGGIVVSLFLPIFKITELLGR